MVKMFTGPFTSVATASTGGAANSGINQAENEMDTTVIHASNVVASQEAITN